MLTPLHLRAAHGLRAEARTEHLKACLNCRNACCRRAGVSAAVQSLGTQTS